MGSPAGRVGEPIQPLLHILEKCACAERRSRCPLPVPVLSGEPVLGGLFI